VKQKLANALNVFLDPIRERRAHFEARPNIVREALATGSARGKKVAEQTMAEVRQGLKLNYLEKS
jgi:tryptophanyl-tRNA synthetase